MEETQAAIGAAKEAGKFLLEAFKGIQDVTLKEAGEIVTEADLKSEKIIFEKLKAEFPEYSILSEEAGREEASDSDMLWIVDPLDGTTNFSIKNPFFGISIALAEKKGQSWLALSGVVCIPFTKEIFFAEKDEGAFLNGERISVSKESELENLLMAYCHGSGKEDLKRVLRIIPEMRPLSRDFTRMRAGAAELAFVACGRLGGYVSPGGMPWDSAAGVLLVREAGGKVTDFKGNDVQADRQGDLIATNGLIHQKILEIISRAEGETSEKEVVTEEKEQETDQGLDKI